ncbi:MAG: hypothetical protein AAGN82_24615 [Myxococcota bacterium]
MVRFLPLRAARRRRWLLPLLGGGYAFAMGAGACAFNEPTPRFGYEYEDVNCTNGVDDDYDGLIDCEDPDCVFTSSQCGEVIPDGTLLQDIENTFERCRDGIDNDANGQFDCGDPKCQGIQELCCTREFTDALCSDGIDNDGNNFADCEDFQCRTGIFVGVCSGTSAGGRPLVPCEQTASGCFVPDDNGVIPEEDSVASCSDRSDNDGNGFADCDDFSCQVATLTASDGTLVPNTVCEISVELCADGLDNDGNGFADCQDRRCDDAPNCEGNYATCFDGEDNDGDGSVDCEDRGCSGEPGGAALISVFGSAEGRAVAQDCSALDPSGPEEGQDLDECRDGIDNDDNGFVDCGDFGCSRSENPDILAFCDDQLENSFDKCLDGIDNDGNGFVDCGDFSCRQSDDPAVVAACQESVAQVLTDDTLGDVPLTPDMKCSDGLDNDLDGFVDCEDWDCSWNPEVTICTSPRVCE